MHHLFRSGPLPEQKTLTPAAGRELRISFSSGDICRRFQWILGPLRFLHWVPSQRALALMNRRLALHKGITGHERLLENYLSDAEFSAYSDYNQSGRDVRISAPGASNTVMIDEKSILELRDRIAAEFQPQRIILFGSYADGTQAEHSDLDLLIIMRYVGSGLRKAVEILDRVQPRVPVDLVVRTPEEVQRRIRENDFFLAEVLRRGRVLYEAPNQ
jgi:uncharacterized protein